MRSVLNQLCYNCPYLFVLDGTLVALRFCFDDNKIKFDLYQEGNPSKIFEGFLNVIPDFNTSNSKKISRFICSW